MAYFTKDQYQMKNEWAAKRMTANKEIATLTEEQHETIAAICALRHEAHTSFSEFWNPQGDSKLSRLFPSEWETEDCVIDEMLSEVNLPPVRWSTQRTYRNSPDVEDYHEEIDDDTNEDDKNEILDCLKNDLLETLTELDQDVRDYLAYIDSVHNTNYAPARSNAEKYLRDQ